MTVGENLASVEWGFRRRSGGKKSDIGNVKVAQEKERSDGDSVICKIMKRLSVCVSVCVGAGE